MDPDPRAKAQETSGPEAKAESVVGAVAALMVKLLDHEAALVAAALTMDLTELKLVLLGHVLAAMLEQIPEVVAEVQEAGAPKVTAKAGTAAQVLL